MGAVPAARAEQWSWTFHLQGRGTVVEQSWQLLRLDPVLGTTRGASTHVATT
ncbi:hypothetical protein [Streptomyces pseudovenezuelae]|uniref:Uncharacterized protein n=1 Tax=Streptomyces pseudovenezuelae TaxID=67350 RepID=A0ABT6M1S4_9ACTN|nr:hypothetical protein [Streptomyces pseudovenezuelae]MDH6222477.1 hypothetical protein [Streptomyces pseudovenezuelae]